MTQDEPKTHQTDWLMPEDRMVSAGSITRYSRIVGSLKLILPISAACILLILVVLPNVNGSNTEPKKLGAMDASMVSPVFNSHDAQNRPYEVKADTAKQQPNAAGITDLSNPKAKIDLDGGKSLSAEGNGAQYNEKNGTLNVQHGIVLRHSDGTTFTTEEAHIDMNSKNAEGNKPVTLQGNFGEVKGEGFKAIDGGKTIIFTGQSSAKLKMGGGGLPSMSNKGQNAPITQPAPQPAPQPALKP